MSNFPPELACIALQQLCKEPWRLKTHDGISRVNEVVNAIVSDWRKRTVLKARKMTIKYRHQLAVLSFEKDRAKVRLVEIGSFLSSSRVY